MNPQGASPCNIVALRACISCEKKGTVRCPFKWSRGDSGRENRCEPRVANPYPPLPRAGEGGERETGMAGIIIRPRLLA
jgi:hypothetical protein